MAGKVADKPSKIGGYKPVQELGAGAMGKLWLCHDPSLDRMVVVKQIQATQEENPDAIKRFMQEGNILAHLNHPAITKPYGLWKESDGKLSLSMEFVHGYTLRNILDKCKQPPLWVTMQVIYEVLSALGHAHRQNVVHRDVKPANIMIDEDGHVRLLDFGIAHTDNQLDFNRYFKDEEDRSRITQTGAILGTVTYMSPEQTLGEDASPASDMFAVGIIALEMLVGANLFRGANFSETIQRIQKLRITEKVFPKDTPAALRKFVLKLLAKKPKSRPVTACDAADQLAAIMKSLPRDLTPYMSVWCAALKESQGPLQESDYSTPALYGNGSKKFIAMGIAIGAVVGAAIATLCHIIL